MKIVKKVHQNTSERRAGTLAYWLAHRTGNLMIDGSNPGRSNHLAGMSKRRNARQFSS